MVCGRNASGKIAVISSRSRSDAETEFLSQRSHHPRALGLHRPLTNRTNICQSFGGQSVLPHFRCPLNWYLMDWQRLCIQNILLCPYETSDQTRINYVKVTRYVLRDCPFKGKSGNGSPAGVLGKTRGSSFIIVRNRLILWLVPVLSTTLYGIEITYQFLFCHTT